MPPVTDINELDRFITPENTLRNQRIGFDVNAGKVSGPSLNTEHGTDLSAEMIEETFNRLLPQLDVQFQDQARGLANRTAGLGRTGSGMFTREAGTLTDRARASRESLLGNLANQAHQADLNRESQAQARRSAQEQAAAQMGQQASMFNVGNDLQTQMAGLQHLIGSQQREDRLAQEAFQNELSRLGLLGQQGFGNNPHAALQGAANINMQGAGVHAGAAGQAAATAGAIGQGIGGSQAQMPAQMPAPNPPRGFSPDQLESPNMPPSAFTPRPIPGQNGPGGTDASMGVPV